MKKDDFKLTFIMLEASKVALLLALATFFLTNDLSLILFEIFWVGFHIMFVFFFEHLVHTLNKK